MITAKRFGLTRRLGITFALLLLVPILRAQCPPPTTPAAPPNGFVTTETQTNFQVNPAGSNVTGYDFFLAQNGGTPARICFNSPSPNCSATLIPAHYEWFVRSFTDSSCPSGAESAHSTLDIIGCTTPVAPTTLTPDAGTPTGASGVTLSWSGGSADTYDVYLEQGSSCTTTTPLNAAPLPASASSIVTGTLTRGATYSWRVRASRGSTCPAPVLSHCASFTVRTCDPPSAPSPLQPADGAHGQPAGVTLTWAAAAGANSYNVWTRTGSNSSFTLAGTSTGTSLNALFPPGTSTEWYVEAVNGTCTTQSVHRTFTTASCGAAAPAALAPAGTISAGPIVFHWSAVSGALRYRVWLAPIAGAFASIEETSDLTFTAHRPSGTYEWYVEAIGIDCPSTRSQTTQFILSPAASCAGASPILQAPQDGSTATGPVTFQWTARAGATRYEVWASLNNAAAEEIGATTVPSMTTDLAPGVVRWYVVAHADGCNDVLSSQSTVTITRPAACAADAAPLLIAPADNAEQLPSTLDFFWTNVAGAQSYKLWVAVDDGTPTVAVTTTATRAQASVPQGRILWFVEATFAGGCGSRRSAAASFRANASSACSLPVAPMLSVPGGAPSGASYAVHWTPAANIDHYEILEWTDDTAATPTLFKTPDVMVSFQHDVVASTRYHYRVRAASNCGAGTGPLSPDASILVAPASSQSVIPFGQGAFTRTLFVPGSGTGVTFTATSDRPWLTITPSSGTLPPDGITLALTADLTGLDAGNSTATVSINTSSVSSSARAVPTAVSTTTPVSISLVTPASPSGKSGTTSSALILPAVAHLDGLATFRSDVRLANTSARPLRYQLTFTPSGTDASLSAFQTSLQVEAGATVALNDLLQSFFSTAGSANASGSLEIKPIVATSDTPGSPSVTFVSSRTFSVTPSGSTSGQFVPALALSRFAGAAGNALFSNLLVPQISQSGAFRTNIGLVEGAVQPAHVVLNFFDAAGSLLSQLPVDLLPGEHRQLNGVVTSSGPLSTAARMEVNVTSATGLVTAYASVLDQTTSDPILVDAVAPASLLAKHYVVPGAAALDAGNGNRWRTDMRVYNAVASAQPAIVSFTPQGSASPTQSIPLTFNAGQVVSLNDVVQSTFGNSNAGGSIAVATADPATLAVTARTYFDTGAGTYGQYIPAFTETGGTGPGERAQQILQVEQSAQYRTNLGLVEVSGSPATILVTALVPELKISPAITLTLPANGFVQYGSILAQLGLSNVYNARLSVQVTSSTGRVAGYGCLIDNTSGDPTYIPSQ